MGSDKLLMAQCGLQAAFGTAVAPTIQVPWTVEYADNREMHSAEWDAGTWSPTTIVALAATGATIKLKGTSFFEMLPVLLSSGLGYVTAQNDQHTYTISPAAAGVPKPLTWLIGEVGNVLGATGPAVKLIDQYLRKLKLSANVNDRMVALEGEMFGTGCDDNSGKGYAFVTVGLPATMEAMNGLRGQVSIQDANTSGGDFTTMTAFACSWLDWELNLDTGIEPKFCLNDNVATFSGIKQTAPAIELDATVRTSANNYLLVKKAADAPVYQELQLIVNGASSRALTVNLTGRWVEATSAHGRKDGEVVMAAKFRAETPHWQNISAHYAAFMVHSTNDWKLI